MMKEKIVALILILIICSSCNKKSEPINISPEDFHASIDKVTEVMIHDIFSPPVASRIYAYPCLLYTSPSPRDRQKSRMPSSA